MRTLDHLIDIHADDCPAARAPNLESADRRLLHGGLGDPLRAPFMTVAGDRTGSDTPLESVTDHFCVPTKPRVEVLFTFGPCRWKLCSFDWSRTSIVYAPGLTVSTFWPDGPVFTSIV